MASDDFANARHSFCLPFMLCLPAKLNYAKESLLPREVPERPWSQVDTNLFIFYNHDYLTYIGRLCCFGFTEL